MTLHSGLLEHRENSNDKNILHCGNNKLYIQLEYLYRVKNINFLNFWKSVTGSGQELPNCSPFFWYLPILTHYLNCH